MDLRTVNKRRFKAEYAWGYLFIMPTIIGLVILNIYPLFDTLVLSLYKKQGLVGMKYVGLENYVKLFGDSLTWQSTLNTFLYVLYTVPIGIFLSLILATMLNNKIRFKSLFRGIYFLPIVVAPAAVTLVWKWIFNSEFGILNQFLNLLGIKGPVWISTPGVTLIAAAIIGIWSNVGYDLVMILAGLQSIPGTLYEAADIDGVNAWQRFFYITIPQISPVLFFVTVMRTMNSLKQFDTIYLLVDRSNPAFRSTQTLMVQFYIEAFQKYNQGYGAAIAAWMFVIIMLITVIQFIGEKKLVHYT
jgi:multiple sugar transport system permease protein